MLSKTIVLAMPGSLRPDLSAPSFAPYCGIGYIAEALRRNNIAYKFFDLAVKGRKEMLFKLIEQLRPEFFGMTMFTLGYRYKYDLLHEIKSLFPFIKIIVGGPHISCLKEKVLEECSAIDYGVVCDGEDTIVELCQGRDVDEIKGLIYRRGEKIEYSGDRPFIIDLDRFGFPVYEGFDLKEYSLRNINISTSRGCYGQCVFCSVATSHGRRVRLRSAGLVYEEIAYWHKRGITIFSIVDDNFLASKERVYDLCELLNRKRLRGLQLRLETGVRADSVDENILRVMVKAGFNKVTFGVESANDYILKKVKKGETLAQIEQAIGLALKVGMQVNLFFIIGLPGETEKEVRNSYDFAKKMKVHNYSFFNLIPYPGTELFEWAKSGGYFIYPPEEYLNFAAGSDMSKAIAPVIETPDFPKEQRLALYLQSGQKAIDDTREAKAELLGKKIGPWCANLLVKVYLSRWFSRVLNRPLVKEALFKIRRYIRI